MVDSSLGQHAVVCIFLSVSCASSIRCQFQRTLELRLPERWSVASDDDELGLARAQRLEGRLVAKGDLTRLWKMSVLCDAVQSQTRINAHLDRQGKLGVDAVAGLAALLWCHGECCLRQ